MHRLKLAQLRYTESHSREALEVLLGVIHEKWPFFGEVPLDSQDLLTWIGEVPGVEAWPMPKGGVVAGYANGTRAIIPYLEGWRESVKAFILAHELGHHLLGHLTVDPQPPQECHANVFALFCTDADIWASRGYGPSSRGFRVPILPDDEFCGLCQVTLIDVNEELSKIPSVLEEVRDLRAGLKAKVESRSLAGEKPRSYRCPHILETSILDRIKAFVELNKSGRNLRVLPKALSAQVAAPRSSREFRIRKKSKSPGRA